MCQRKYALQIVEECGRLGAKPLEFLIETNHKLALAHEPKLDEPTRYRCLIGCLIYLTITRLELCYAVHVLSQCMQEPKEEHTEVAKCVLRYLKGNPGQGLLWHSESDMLVYAYCDSDWGHALSLEDRSLATL